MMDLVVKAFLSKFDNSTEVRRLHFSISGPDEISGKFGHLHAQLAAVFPDLKGKSFIVSWKDSDGDFVLMSSDEELLEALSEMENKQLKVYLTESPAELGDDATSAMFPAGPTLRKVRGPWMRVSEEEAGERSVQDPKGWKTSLRDLVPTKHRRWAKGYIRQWRQKHLANGTSTGSSDGEKLLKVTAEEANVPPEYIKYLDTQVFRLHKVWAQEKPGKIEQEFEEAKAAVPQAFQNWCRWYLKKTFGPNRTPKFRVDKKKAESNLDETQTETKEKVDDKARKEKSKKEKESNVWKKEWKIMRKQIRDAVSPDDREWTKKFIKQWRTTNLAEEDRARYVPESSSSSSSSEDDSKNDAPERKGNQDNYARWLNLYLTQWHSNQKDTVLNQNLKEASKELKEIKDTDVPPSYRKWVKFYISRVLSKEKKDKQREAEVIARRQYYSWMLLFQEKWVANQTEATSASSGEEADIRPKKDKTIPKNIDKPRTIIERLQGIIDSDGEYENELPIPLHSKPPSEFRHWALEIFRSWDCVTVGHGLPANIMQAAGEEDAEPRIPPGVLNWMRKAMARVQIKRLRVELKEARKEKEAKTTAKEDVQKSCTKDGGKSVRHAHQE